MDSRYERNIFLFLSLYRFLAYGLAVVLIQVVPLGEDDTLSGQDYSLLSGFGVYTLFKILGPLRWREEGAMTYIMLGGDLLLATVAVLLTGGLNSGFLLYALTPILTGALLFTETLAIATAAVTSASLAIAHLLLYRWVDKFVWIMEENNLLWLIVFIVTTFLFASVVYRTNLNIRRRIEAQVILQPNGKGLDLFIRDNGCGFDLEGFAANGQGHYGLKILGERAESLGGSLNINSSLGGGTEVKVNLPGRVRVR